MIHLAMNDSALLPLLIEPETLVQELNNPDLLIIDLCSQDHYLQGHVPGAIHVNPSYTQLGQPPAPGLLPGKDQLSGLMSAIGYSEDKHIVVYDDEGGGWAGRFIWMLDSLGINRYSYLNGGLITWVNEGHPTEREIRKAVPCQYEATISNAPTIDINELLTIYNHDDVVIWDARSADEYNGLRSGAMRPGRIPGAVHFEWTQGMDPQRNYRVKDLELLSATLNQIGINPTKRIITHCQTHHRSGFTYLLGKLLGFPEIQAYAGSWGEWGNRPDTPVE